MEMGWTRSYLLFRVWIRRSTLRSENPSSWACWLLGIPRIRVVRSHRSVSLSIAKSANSSTMARFQGTSWVIGYAIAAYLSALILRSVPSRVSTAVIVPTTCSV